MIRSPFFVVENFISPATCEKLIDELSLSVPSVDEDGKPLKYERTLIDADHIAMIRPNLEEQVSAIEQRYHCEIKGMEAPILQQYFEDPKSPAEQHGCENSKFLRKKWVKVKDVDLVGFIWLKDFNTGVPLDPRMEVYGGKLEFPAYNFSLCPQRGTLILYPAGPHFITAVSPILVGSLEQIKITMKLRQPGGEQWLYQPHNFPGTYQEWFSQEN